MKKYASVDKPIYCTVTTHKAFKYQIKFDCNGFYGGTSGSPWLKNYNRTTRRGDVMGVIGGYQEGGKYDWRSYSSVFDKDINHLFTTAKSRLGRARRISVRLRGVQSATNKIHRTRPVGDTAAENPAAARR